MGLRSSTLPTEILERMVSEDDLLAAFGNLSTSSDSENPASTSSGSNHHASAAFGSQHSTLTASGFDNLASVALRLDHLASTNYTLKTLAPSASDTAQDVELDIAQDAELDASHSQIQKQRKVARQGLTDQAERMVKRSRIEHKAGNPGENVTIPIPMVDRGRGDPRNLIGIIIDRDVYYLYRIAVRGGVLKGKYTRNQFDLCVQKLRSEKDVNSTEEVALRTAVQFESNCGGQGFVKCNCKWQWRLQIK